MAIVKSAKKCTYSKAYVKMSLRASDSIISAWPSWKIDSMRNHDTRKVLVKEPLITRSR